MLKNFGAIYEYLAAKNKILIKKFVSGKYVSNVWEIAKKRKRYICFVSRKLKDTNSKGKEVIINYLKERDLQPFSFQNATWQAITLLPALVKLFLFFWAL
jgi:hypothetical protein